MIMCIIGRTCLSWVEFCGRLKKIVNYSVLEIYRCDEYEGLMLSSSVLRMRRSGV